MKSKYFLQLIIVCFCFISFSAHAIAPKPQEAISWSEDKGNLLLQTFQEKNLAQKYQDLDNLFLNYVDLEYIGKFVIGKYWKEMSKEQQQEYLSLFKRYALAAYKGFPLTFQYPITFSINNAIVSRTYTEVFATIDLGGNFQSKENQEQKINVIFRLVQNAKGIKIIDLKLAESSLILSYRNRFYQMVGEAEGDMTWFLEDFATMVTSTEKSNQQKLEESQQ